MDFIATVLPRLALGLIISLLIGWVAYRRGSLSRSGVLGAVITGTTIFGFGGWIVGILLVAFFVSSSLLSHFKQNNTQKQRAAEMFDKSGQRDIWQALANGGAAMIFVIIGQHQSVHYRYELAGSVTCAAFGALATVNADTWATELGILSKSRPRLITRPFHTVEPGTSGAVSIVGILAAFAGALFIAVVFVVLRATFDGPHLFLNRDSLDITPIYWVGWATFPRVAVARLISVTTGGLIGSLFDSFLGATKQATYYSNQRQKETEKAFEKDKTPNKHIRGWKWLSNDWVNFISSVVGALVASLIFYLIFVIFRLLG